MNPHTLFFFRVILDILGALEFSYNLRVDFFLNFSKKKKD